MKEKTAKLIKEQMSKASRALTHGQRIKNGRKAWQTRIKNLETKTT